MRANGLLLDVMGFCGAVKVMASHCYHATSDLMAHPDSCLLYLIWNLKYIYIYWPTVTQFYDIWVRSRRWGCFVTWYCYEMGAKPGNKAAPPWWPDPYDDILWWLATLTYDVPVVPYKRAKNIFHAFTKLLYNHLWICLWYQLALMLLFLVMVWYMLVLSISFKIISLLG